MPLAEHDAAYSVYVRPALVSIHVPLAEHDHGRRRRRRYLVSIHVPLAEHDCLSTLLA